MSGHKSKKGGKKEATVSTFATGAESQDVLFDVATRSNEFDICRFLAGMGPIRADCARLACDYLFYAGHLESADVLGFGVRALSMSIGATTLQRTFMGWRAPFNVVFYPGMTITKSEVEAHHWNFISALDLVEKIPTQMPARIKVQVKPETTDTDGMVVPKQSMADVFKAVTSHEKFKIEALNVTTHSKVDDQPEKEVSYVVPNCFFDYEFTMVTARPTAETRVNHILLQDISTAYSDLDDEYRVYVISVTKCLAMSMRTNLTSPDGLFMFEGDKCTYKSYRPSKE
jgi:hypothetical protein